MSAISRCRRAASKINSHRSTALSTPRIVSRFIGILALCVLKLRTLNYDAILVLAFGGPESKEEVVPFLELMATLPVFTISKFVPG
jgi:hypothetical protein